MAARGTAGGTDELILGWLGVIDVLLVLLAVGAGLVAVMRMDVSPRSDPGPREDTGRAPATSRTAGGPASRPGPRGQAPAG